MNDKNLSIEDIRSLANLYGRELSEFAKYADEIMKR